MLKQFFKCIVLASLLISCSDGSKDSTFGSSNVGKEQFAGYGTKLDILWVIDNSVDTKNKKAQIADKMDSFFSKIVTLGLDFHVAAITTDSAAQNELGHFIGNPNILDRETWNLQSAFSQLVQPIENIVTVNTGFDAILSALSWEKLMTVNKNFLREDALLVVIFVSDKEDASVSDLQEVEATLNRLKPSDKKQGWIFHSISPNEAGCGKSIATKVKQLAIISNGINSDYCDSTESSLLNIRDASIEVVTEIPLLVSTNVDTVSIAVNSVLVPRDVNNGWSYYAANHSIRFYGSAVPAADTIIKLTQSPR